MTYKSYKVEEILKIIDEFNEGTTKFELSKKYNISRSTIRYWLNNKEKIINNEYDYSKNKIYPELNEYLFDKKVEYNYILGLYLGDGCITKSKRLVYKIRIFLDSRYYNIVDECVRNLKILLPFNKVGIYKTKHNMFVVSINSNFLVDLFPQIGEGKKHNRKINFSKFQSDIIDHKNLIRGLFHSDGCLYKNTITKKTGKSYFGYYYNFSNRSKDIADIYCNSLNALNINYTTHLSKLNCYRINVNRRDDFKKMYDFLGVKNLEMKNDVEKYYNNIKTKIVKPITTRKQKILNYCKCGKQITKRANQCEDCYNLNQRKVDRPSIEELKMMIKETSLESVGRRYGVSGNAVKKWIK